MTPEELKKLAEIAGIKTYDMFEEIVVHYDGNYHDWRPYEDIAQALMVADAFTEWKVGKYRFNDLPIIYECVLTIEDCEELGQGSTPAEAICQAVLAAKEA